MNTKRMSVPETGGADSKGLRLAHYELLGTLGEGGMGVVYKARDLQLGRLVALKILSPAGADGDRNQRFHQEARAASALSNPHIVTIYEIGRDEEREYIAMEFVDGRRLDEVIRGRRLPWQEAVALALQVADALAAAHAASITHRDLKPANIMVTEQGVVKLFDFGLAKVQADPLVGDLADTETMRTEPGAVLGTYAYMSPEQAEGQEVDRRSDIFSFGVLLYELITGRRPFERSSKIGTLAALLHDDPTPVHEVTPDAPEELGRIVARCLRKQPERRYQHADDLKLTLEELLETATRRRRRFPVRLSWRRVAVAAGAVVLLLAGARFAAWHTNPPEPTGAYSLVRLTANAGLSTDPTITPDGTLLAYASDRQGGSSLDIWVQQVAGGDPVRLTDGPADERHPSFSPDGTRIVYRSEQNGGGIYTVSSLRGGDPHFIAAGGRNPRFSPDGDWIAYWVGEPHFGRHNQVYVVSSRGGEPRPVAAPFTDARFPVWSPDGKYLLIEGVADRTHDWWVLPFGGGDPVATGCYTLFRRLGFVLRTVSASDLAEPAVWIGKQVLLSAQVGETENLWQVEMSGLRATDYAARLTFGTGREVRPSAADGGRIVFAGLTVNADVWSFPLEARAGKVTGEPVRLTEGEAQHVQPAISADEKKLMYRLVQTAGDEIRVRDLASGRETALQLPSFDESPPVLSAAGDKIAYRSRGRLYVTYGAGPGEVVCERCGRPWQWTPDGRGILYQSNSPLQLWLLDTATSGTRQLLGHPTADIFEARMSPGGRWIAFHIASSPTRRQVFVAPFDKERPVPAAAWIAITDGSGNDRNVAWSPDSSLLYFLSQRDGFRCVWAQAFDPATGRPRGPAFAVRHFHSARNNLMSGSSPSQIGLSVTPGRLLLSMLDIRGNIWMLDPGKQTAFDDF